MPLVIRSFQDLNCRTLSNALAKSFILGSWRPSRGKVESIADSCPWLINSSFEPQLSYIHISLYISTHVCVYVTVCLVSQLFEAFHPFSVAILLPTPCRPSAAKRCCLVLRRGKPRTMKHPSCRWTPCCRTTVWGRFVRKLWWARSLAQTGRRPSGVSIPCSQLRST